LKIGKPQFKHRSVKKKLVIFVGMAVAIFIFACMYVISKGFEFPPNRSKLVVEERKVAVKPVCL